MSPGGKGCLGALAVVAVALAIAGALLGPRAVRTARELYAPISEMKRSERALREVEERNPWKPPETPAVSPEQLERFLAVRRRLDAVYREVGPLDELAREDGSIAEVPQVLRGVGALVSRQLQALAEHGFSTDEYRYLERIVYRTWREGLRRAGQDPAISLAAAAAIGEAAAAEREPRTARRLAEVAESLRRRRAPPPEGIPAEVHALLLAHASEIDRYSLDAYDELPMGRRR